MHNKTLWLYIFLLVLCIPSIILSAVVNEEAILSDVIGATISFVPMAQAALFGIIVETKAKDLSADYRLLYVLALLFLAMVLIFDESESICYWLAVAHVFIVGACMLMVGIRLHGGTQIN